MPMLAELARHIGSTSEFRVESHKDTVRRLNPDHDPQTLFDREFWDIVRFSEGNHLPVVVSELEDKDRFAQQNSIRVLDMPLYIPGQGWGIPPELGQFGETIRKAVEHESVVNPEIDDYHVYITIDQKPVVPGKSQRRPGWHTDAYITDETGMQIDVVAENRDVIEGQNGRLVDRTYIIYDDSGLPTLFLPGPFPLTVDPQDCDAVLQTFDEMAQGKTPVTYPPFTLLRLDPYDVHTPAFNEKGEIVNRTFVKISFSKQVYNRDMNTHNPLLDYNWTLVPRDPGKREHRNILLGYDNPERHLYRSIDPAEVLQDGAAVAWAKPEVFRAKKVEGVRAEKAVAGERLETRVDGKFVTTNVAQEGWWKITTSQGDQYFLTGKQFLANYQKRPDGNGVYSPKGIVKTMVELTENVCFVAPWGAIQYVPKGGMLVISDKHDLYGIHPSNFAASYQNVG